MISEVEVVRRVHSRFMARSIIGRGPAPHKVDVSEYGHHASYVKNGYRIWGFKSKAARDSFIKVFQAELCE